MQDLTITLIQTNLIWENADKNLAHIGELLQSVSGTDLILLPEMFSTGFTMNSKQRSETMNGKSVAWMKKMAEEKNSVVTGSLIIEDNKQYFNRLIWMEPDGNFLVYDKRHLFALAGEEKFYSQGNKKIFPELKGWKVLPLICYDLRFPVWSRQSPPYTEMGKQPYDLLLYVANWPERRIYAWQHLLIARAIENQCYVAGVNRVGNDGNEIYYSGHSAVIDPMGEKLIEIAVDESVETVTLSQHHLLSTRAKFRFLNDRDEFELKS